MSGPNGLFVKKGPLSEYFVTTVVGNFIFDAKKGTLQKTSLFQEDYLYPYKETESAIFNVREFMAVFAE